MCLPVLYFTFTHPNLFGCFCHYSPFPQTTFLTSSRHGKSICSSFCEPDISWNTTPQQRWLGRYFCSSALYHGNTLRSSPLFTPKQILKSVCWMAATRHSQIPTQSTLLLLMQLSRCSDLCCHALSVGTCVQWSNIQHDLAAFLQIDPISCHMLSCICHFTFSNVLLPWLLDVQPLQVRWRSAVLPLQDDSCLALTRTSTVTALQVRV